MGEIGGPETWWVRRQQALERTDYLLRPRYSTTQVGHHHGLAPTIFLSILKMAICARCVNHVYPQSYIII